MFHLNVFDFRLMIGYQVISFFICSSLFFIYSIANGPLLQDVVVFKAYFYTAKTNFLKNSNYPNNELFFEN